MCSRIRIYSQSHIFWRCSVHDRCHLLSFFREGDLYKRDDWKVWGGWLITRCSLQVLDALATRSNLSGHMCQSSMTLLAVSNPACSEQRRIMQCQHLPSTQIFSGSHQLEFLLCLNSIVVCQIDMYPIKIYQISYKKVYFY